MSSDIYTYIKLMHNPYLRKSPRGDSNVQAAFAGMLPGFTDQLNTLNKSLFLTSRIKEMAKQADSNLVEILADVETQGKFNSFLNICLLDLMVIYKNASTAIHFWEDTYCLRQGYQLIYESIQTYAAHSKSLKELAMRTSPAAKDMFTELSKQIKAFRKEFDYNKTILNIRNDTIGHIQRDPVEFFKRISQFDADKAFHALKEFASILVSMLTLSNFIFVNYTKKTIADSSFRLSGLDGFPLEIEKLLNLF